MPFQSFTIAEILKSTADGHNGPEIPSVIVKNPLHTREPLFPAFSSATLFWNNQAFNNSVKNVEKICVPNILAVDRSSKSGSTPSKSAPAESSSTKRRRSRTVFSDAQLLYLEERFTINKYLTTPDRTKVARSLGLTQLQIKTWYQNRRMRWKKAILRSEGHSAEGLSSCLHKNKGRPRKTETPVTSSHVHAAPPAEGGR